MEASSADDPGAAYPSVLERFEKECAEEKTKVLEAGGLHIVGTERHESRRIDNQLRGRSGRQGDQGSSRFFLSLEDDLLRIFGSDRISTIMDKLGMEEDEPIEHTMISKAIENAQRKVEGHNFDIRKHLLEYDDVMNEQRQMIYDQRKEVLGGEDVSYIVADMFEDLIAAITLEFCDDKTLSEDWDWDGISERVSANMGIELDWDDDVKKGLKSDTFEKNLLETMEAAYKAREEELGEETMRQLERFILLQIVDTHWKDHLLGMDHLKEGIGLRGYGQKNPLDEYKKEGFNMFNTMIERVREKTVSTLMRVQLARQDEMEQLEEEKRRRKTEMEMSRGAGNETPARQQPARREGEKIGRNAPCPCGSGKKYKRCCGRTK
jgi:preprotein translocase subunit SecA